MTRDLETTAAEIIVRPNDRLIRGVLVCIAMTWWIAQAVERIHDRSVLMVFVPLWLALFVPMAWLLAWIAVGRWVFTVSAGALIVERRLAAVGFRRTAYPIAALGSFRVEEQRRKIKGNTSPRYLVLSDGVNGTRTLAWYRRKAEAEALAIELQELVRAKIASG